MIWATPGHKVFTGHYRDDDGRRRSFWLIAEDYDTAESHLESLKVNGEIDGEFVSEEDVDQPMIGRA